MKFPLIPITLFFALGIVFYFYWRLAFLWILVLCLFSALCFGVSFWRSGRKLLQDNFFGIFTYIISFSFGILAHSLHFEPGYENHYSHFTSDSNTLQGTISERLKPNKHSEKYYFKISQIDGKEVFGKVLLNVPKKEIAQQYHSGNELIINSDLQLIPKQFNPYQFDYSAYLEKQNVFHQLYLKSGNHIQISTRHNFDYYVEQYRNTLLNSFAIHNFSPGTENIIKALLLGQRQDMDRETATNYTNAGVIHILAISGLHIAILYALLLLILKPLHRFRKGKLLQFLIILGFLWVFAILSGLSASVVRSVVMFSFMSLGLYLNKSGNIYNTLAVSMLAILLINPNLLFDVGFQLSYLAVFAIVWLQPFYKSVSISKYRVINYFVDTLTISFAAQIGVLPLSLYYFNQLPLLFLLANLVVIPLSSFVLVLGITVLLFNFILPELALFLGRLLSYCIEIMNNYISWVASFERFVIKDIPFSFALLLISYIALAALVFWLYEKQAKRLLLFLSASLVLQVLLLTTFWQTKQGSEFIVFNSRKSTLITEKQGDKIFVYTNDSLATENTNLKAYNRGNFNLKMEMRPLGNVISYRDQKILLIDSLGIYKIGQQPNVVLLTQSPKINLTRVIQELHPQKIIADATNYRSYVKRWKATCEKEKIPFHATAEKGFYRIDN
nr:ComEC/Rec2 family competence protein [uncultured Flavobacterium sp.]